MQTDAKTPRYNITVGSAPVKFVWFRVAKCGTRSTFRLLRDHVTEFELENGFDRHFRRKKYAAYSWFSVVRNPYDRIVSAWNDKVRLDNPGFRAASAAQHAKMQDFAYFMDWLVDQPPGCVNIHFRAQCLLVPPCVDRIGRLENFNRDMTAILKDAGFANITDIPHKNKRVAPPAQSLLSPRMIGLVNDYYQRDFERFGYDRRQ